MAACQTCGKANPETASVCVDCGSALSAPRKANLAGTMLGMPSPFASPQPAQMPESDEPKKVPHKKDALGGTMIGMPSPLAPQHSQNPVVGRKTPDPMAGGVNPVDPNLGRTMIGMGTSSPKASSPDPKPSQDQKFKGTLLGIARPGIAPTGEAPPPPVTRRAEEQGKSPSAAARISSIPVAQPFPTTRPRWLTWAFVFGGLLVATGMGAAVAWFSPKPIVVRVDKFSIDETGNDQLDLICKGCPDGSSLILGEAHAKVRSEKAELKPKMPLSLGRNELEFRLDEGGTIRKAKKIILPIAFRVLTRWSGIHEENPFAEVTVAAPGGSKVEIGGELTALEGERATKRIHFEAETEGEASQLTQVQRELAIEVTVGGELRKTRAEIRGAVTPLTLTSPAPIHHLKGKPVAVSGRTAPRAKVKIGEAEVEADASGDFSHVIESPQAGVIMVSAYKEELLRRRVSLELSNDAPKPPQAVTGYAELKPGLLVDISGNVLESRTVDGTTRVLLEVERGCGSPPCLLRAVYGEPMKLAPNRGARVTGLVTGGDPPTVRVFRFR